MKNSILSLFLRAFKKIQKGSLEQGGKNYCPWGYFIVLEEREGYKVKRIEVVPGKRLSYQKHEKRAEHWVIVHGEALVTLDGRGKRLIPGQSIDIPQRVPHRIANPGADPLIFIEIQRGEYLGEDDITRLEDDFGRTGEP